MKKMLMTLFGVMLIGSAVWAVNVNNVPVKSDFSNGAITAQNQVSYVEFNSLVQTIKGIFNKYVGGRNKIGINTTPSDVATLKLKGLIRVKPLSAENRPNCENNIEGAIYAETGNGNHLWGCNGAAWVQLDTDAPVCQ